jgi:DNA-directed RNA polymerase subunit N (RpoN/RPB10)
MSLTSKVPVFCMNCGKAHNTDFKVYGGRVCSDVCHLQLEKKRILSMMGKDFTSEASQAWMKE